MRLGLAAQIHLLANIAIALGYFAAPIAFLPFLDLRRRTRGLGAGFFIGCVGTHGVYTIWQTLQSAAHHPPVGWVAATWHVGQAVCVWAFIFSFRSELADASSRLDRVTFRKKP